MYIESDIQINNEQAKQFATSVYDDFIEYMNSKTDSEKNDNDTNNVN